MVSILIFAVSGLLVVLSLGTAPDSREHIPSEEEKLASYGMSWGAQEDYQDQLALAAEIRAALQQYRARRSAGGDLVNIQESQEWAACLAA